MKCYLNIQDLSGKGHEALCEMFEGELWVRAEFLDGQFILDYDLKVSESQAEEPTLAIA